MKLSADELLVVLPHRWPFVLLDGVTELEAGTFARGVKAVTLAEPWFPGHFPGRAIFPGVLVVEALAQLGCVLAAVTNGADPAVATPAGGSRLPVALLGIDGARFRKPVLPGHRLDLEVRVLQRRGPVWRLAGTAHAVEANGTSSMAAEAELMVSHGASPSAGKGAP